MMPEPADDDHAAARRFVIDNTRIESPPLRPDLRLHLASAVTPLWLLTAKDLDEHGVPPPYWAFAWPGGQAIARLLLDRPELVRARTVLDFAAGCGVAALAAVRAGAAHVTASEIDAHAAAALDLNAALNGMSVDVIRVDLTTQSTRAFDVILAGDVCYEQAMAQQAMAWLRARAAAGAMVLLGDPGRAYLPAGLNPIARYDVPIANDVEDATVKTATVYDLSQAARAESSTIV